MSGPVEELCLRYAQASLVLKRREVQEVQALCVVLKSFFKSQVLKLVDDAAGRPILQSYSSDGTPLLTRQRMRIRMKGAAESSTVRVGGAGNEFLVQQGFVRYREASGKFRTAVLLREPLPLSEGKSAWAVFAAGKEFMPTLARMNHSGIAIQHFAFGRALHRPLVRHFSELCAVEAASSVQVSGDYRNAMRDLLTWVVDTPCANHDCHNAFKWGLFSAFHNADMLKDIYVVIESVRNGYTLLHSHMAAWLQGIVAFVQEPEPADHLIELYTALGVEPECTRTISNMGLLFRGGRLEVHSVHMSSASLFQDLSSALLHLWRFTRFSDSRWCTVGRSCRVLAVGLLTGLGSLVEQLLADKQVSKFHLGGFQKLTKASRRFVVMAAICAYPSDGVLGELLEDDRVGHRLVALEETLREEMGFVCGLSDSAWGLLSIAAGAPDRALRADTIASAHVSVGFITVKIFRKARRNIWGLLQGDLAQNLETLKEQEDEPDNETLFKLQRLMQLGFNQVQILEALELVKDISWSTTGVEQQHGSASTIMKLHETYSKETMCARALVHACRQFFSPKVEEQEVAALQRNVARLEGKVRRAASFTGRQFFFKELLQTGSAQLARGAKEMPDDWRQRVMRRHATMWRSLDPRSRRNYELRAQMARDAKAKVNDDELGFARDALSIGKLRQAEVAEDRSRKLLLSQCRFSDADKAQLDMLWRSPGLTSKTVQDAMTKAMRAPPPPPPELQEALGAVALRGSKPKERPFWLQVLCQHREIFANTALVIRVEGAEPIVIKLAFAYQSPFLAVFSPMVLVREYFRAQSMCRAIWEEQSLSAWRFKYQCDYSQVVTDDEVGEITPSELWVLPGLCAMGGDILVTDVEPIQWALFAAGLASKKAKNTQDSKRAKTAAASVVTPEMLQEMPWLWEFAERRQQSQRCHKKGDVDAASSEEEHEAKDVLEGPAQKDADIEAIFDELRQKREAWLDNPASQMSDFKADVLGGQWTKANTGASYDYFCGRATNKAAETWCRKYCTGLSARFSKNLYGDEVASMFSRYWVAKMQHFYDIYLAADSSSSHACCEADLGSWTEPSEVREKEASLDKAALARLAELRALRPVMVGSSS